MVVFAFVFAGLTTPENKVKVPLKKINKAVKKVWKTENFEVIIDEENTAKNCFDKGCWLKVKEGEAIIGMIYVGRVNSCRSGGCSIDMDEESMAFEFFDYFLLTDLTGAVLWVKVFNYQATRGHEVMSRGWLNQFKGVKPSEELVFGQDIEAISGATVSASEMTKDIQNVLGCVTLN